MMSMTHAIIGISVASFALGTVDPLVLGVAAIGSQLPDIDTSKSIVGRLLFPISWILERYFPHRTITHSFFMTGIVAGLSLPLRFHNVEMWKALLIGFFFGWFADVFTKSGVAAFYPATSARLVVPANPNLRLRTGSKAEYIIILLFLCLGVVSFNLHSAGGILRVFNAAFGQPSGAAELFREEGHARQILAHIEGQTNAGSVSGEFEVVDVLQGDTLLVCDSSGAVYSAGDRKFCSSCEIAIHNVKARTGKQISVAVSEIRFHEQDVFAALRKLNVPPNSRVLINGNLTFADSANLNVPQSLQKFNPVRLEGEEVKTAKLHAASVDDLRVFAGFEASGQLLVRVVSIE